MIVLGVMYLLLILGIFTKIGLIFLASGLLGVFTLGWIYTNGSITYVVAYNSGTGAFATNSIDPNLIAVVVAVSIIVQFIFLFYERYNVE